MVTQAQLALLLDEYKNLVQYQVNSEERSNTLKTVMNTLQIMSFVGFVFFAYASEEQKKTVTPLVLSVAIMLLISMCIKNPFNKSSIQIQFEEVQQQFQQANTQHLRDNCNQRIKIIIVAIYEFTAATIIKLLMQRGLERSDRTQTLDIISINLHAYISSFVSELPKNNIRQQFECDEDTADKLFKSYKSVVSQVINLKDVSNEQLDSVLNTLADIVEQDWAAKSRANNRPSF